MVIEDKNFLSSITASLMPNQKFMKGGKVLMQKIMTEVKSQGKVLGQVEVVQYSSLAEAVKASSEENVLKAYNKVVSNKITNTYRSEQTRSTSPVLKLAKMAKSDSNIAAEIEKLIATAAKG